MPYNDDGNWIYEHAIPSSGDPTRVAGELLGRDIESFLWDTRHPGYFKSEYLSWALARYDATKNSSGNAPDSVLFWDPSQAERPFKHEKGGSPNSKIDVGIRYDAPEPIRVDEHGGEAELYPTEPRFQPVPDPNLARFSDRNAYVVTPRHYPAPAPAEDPAPEDGED